MLSRYLGHGRWERVRGLHRRGVGDLGAADRRGAAPRQDAAQGVAADHRGDLLAAPERGQVARHPGRTRPVVAGRAAVPPLGQAGRLGAPARVGATARRDRAGHGLPRRHEHPRPPEGGGGEKGGSDRQERDHREALGRSRGGWGTKACVIADGRGRAIGFALAPGQAHELPLAPGLPDRLPDVPGWVVGDRGLTSDAFRERIWDLGARPAIPPKRTDAPVACPDRIYVNRRRVENLWARLKEWRAVATRYEKTARSFLGVLCIAATAGWLQIAKL